MSTGTEPQKAGADRYDICSQTPELKKPKKLIVCCDGTWQNSDNQTDLPTNVTRISRAVRTYDDDYHQQIVYYQAGVGTGIGLYDRIAGGAAGVGLAEHIREAYSFLADNYAAGKTAPGASDVADSIFLIGFSRGAFTARSIGALLGALGLLDKKAMQYFFDIFTDWENSGYKAPKFFKKYFRDFPEQDAKNAPTSGARTRSSADIDAYLKAYMDELLRLGLTQRVRVQAIGVWETVGSLGIPVPPFLLRLFSGLPTYIKKYRWFDTRIGNHVNQGFQALALDEHRAPYSPAVWENPDGSTAKIKQTWFPGAHSNVGGSYNDYGIADLTIAWMMDHLSGHHEEGKIKSMDWIRFDDSSIDFYYIQRARWHQKIVDKLEEDDQTVPHNLPGWSLGTIYNSAVFPQSITGIRVRTPGQYHAKNYWTGRTTKRLLENTNEYIHPSVRARELLDGSAPVIDWGKSFKFLRTISAALNHAWFLIPGHSIKNYKPNASGQPLAQWDLPSDDTQQTGQIDNEWTFHGKAEAVRNTILPEDRLGGPDSYERHLLDMSINRDRFQLDEQGRVTHIEPMTTGKVKRRV